MQRKIITIDEEKCTGCGLCIPHCPEGAMQLIDGKARLISDLFCDGLGACLGECPEGAISIEAREAQPYDEKKVMENIVRQGKNVIGAHLQHLQDHRQGEYFEQALSFLEEQGIDNPLAGRAAAGKSAVRLPSQAGRREARPHELSKQKLNEAHPDGKKQSQLDHWPIQLRLMSPLAPQFRGKDALLAADCVAYAAGDFHRSYLRGKALAIACPKLDDNRDGYVEQIRSLIDDAKINTLTVMIMEVPCCRDLLNLARQARARASRKAPLKCIVVGLEGDVLSEEWV